VVIYSLVGLTNIKKLNDMEKIFIIIINPHDVCDSKPIGFVNTEEEAKSVINKLNKFYQDLEDYCDILNDKVKNIRHRDLNYENYLTLPNRDEPCIRNDYGSIQDDLFIFINMENENIKKRNQEKFQERNNDVIKAIDEILKSLDDSEYNNYVRKSLDEYGDIKEHLYSYTYKELNRM